MSDDSAPGWDAIDLALKPLYGDQEPLHWAPPLHHMLGGADPLDGISAYRRAEPLPHWHFVTYGFTELYAKDTSDAEISGYGFELTFRLRAASSEESPPTWALSFLQNLARYVFSSGNAFDAGHYMHLNGPIALGSDTKIWAIVLTPDPELPAIDTLHGRLQFLQVVGITLDELAAIKAWDAASFLGLIKPHVPLFVTDLGRSSLTDDSTIAEVVQSQVRKDGSSTDSIFVGTARWRVDKGLLRPAKLVLTLGANGVADFRAVLPGRLPHGRSFMVASKDQTITFTLSDQCSWESRRQANMTVYLTPDAATDLVRVILPKRGSYSMSAFPNLSILVVPSEIKDAKGNVIDVIG
jgi:hypothetical protein